MKKDPKKGDEYIDILIGKKGSNIPHSHFGLNLDQTFRFVEPRSAMHSIRREIDSKFKGRISDEKIKFDGQQGPANFTFKVLIHGPTKTIEVKLKEAKLTET